MVDAKRIELMNAMFGNFDDTTNKLRPNRKRIEASYDKEELIFESTYDEALTNTFEREKILLPVFSSGHYFLVEINIDHVGRTIACLLFEPYGFGSYDAAAEEDLKSRLFTDETVAQLQTKGYRVDRKPRRPVGSKAVQKRGGPCGLYLLWFVLLRMYCKLTVDAKLFEFPPIHTIDVGASSSDNFLENKMRPWLSSNFFLPYVDHDADAPRPDLHNVEGLVDLDAPPTKKQKT
jgi:hypothetical protein